WCGPCQMMSACLSSPSYDSACIDLFGGDPGVIDVLANPLRAAIAEETMAWVTVLMENNGGGAPSSVDAVAWDQQFPNEKIWVIPDVEQNYFGHVPLQGFPSFWLIGPDMNYLDLNQMTVFGTIISLF
ncbi:MAG: hypothetical protein ACPHRO_07110, partial [Nannocystaceae bacterium]